MQQGMPQEFSGQRGRRAHQLLDVALRNHFAAEPPRTRTEIDDMVRAPDGVFIMLHDQQGVAFFLQLLQGVQENLVVARMQADGGFVQDVANPAQVGAKLRSQPDALRLAS